MLMSESLQNSWKGSSFFSQSPAIQVCEVRRTSQLFFLIRQPGEGARHPSPRLHSPNITEDNVDDSFVQQIKEVAHEGAVLAAALYGLRGIAENQCLPKAKWTVEENKSNYQASERLLHAGGLILEIWGVFSPHCHQREHQAPSTDRSRNSKRTWG